MTSLGEQFCFMVRKRGPQTRAMPKKHKRQNYIFKTAFGTHNTVLPNELKHPKQTGKNTAGLRKTD
jgi:hypothetical protein